MTIFAKSSLAESSAPFPEKTQAEGSLEEPGSAHGAESGPRPSDPAHRHEDEGPTTPWAVSG